MNLSPILNRMPRSNDKLSFHKFSYIYYQLAISSSDEKSEILFRFPRKSKLLAALNNGKQTNKIIKNEFITIYYFLKSFLFSFWRKTRERIRRGRVASFGSHQD